MAAIESLEVEIDIFVFSVGNFNILTFDNMEKMRSNAIGVGTVTTRLTCLEESEGM